MAWCALLTACLNVYVRRCTKRARLRGRTHSRRIRQIEAAAVVGSSVWRLTHWTCSTEDGGGVGSWQWTRLIAVEERILVCISVCVCVLPFARLVWYDGCVLSSWAAYVLFRPCFCRGLRQNKSAAHDARWGSERDTSNKRRSLVYSCSVCYPS